MTWIMLKLRKWVPEVISRMSREQKVFHCGVSLEWKVYVQSSSDHGNEMIQIFFHFAHYWRSRLTDCSRSFHSTQSNCNLFFKWRKSLWRSSVNKLRKIKHSLSCYLEMTLIYSDPSYFIQYNLNSRYNNPTDSYLSWISLFRIDLDLPEPMFYMTEGPKTHT